MESLGSKNSDNKIHPTTATQPDKSDFLLPPRNRRKLHYAVFSPSSVGFHFSPNTGEYEPRTNIDPTQDSRKADGDLTSLSANWDDQGTLLDEKMQYLIQHIQAVAAETSRYCHEIATRKITADREHRESIAHINRRLSTTKEAWMTEQEKVTKLIQERDELKRVLLFEREENRKSSKVVAQQRDLAQAEGARVLQDLQVLERRPEMEKNDMLKLSEQFAQQRELDRKKSSKISQEFDLMKETLTQQQKEIRELEEKKAPGQATHTIKLEQYGNELQEAHVQISTQPRPRDQMTSQEASDKKKTCAAKLTAMKRTIDRVEKRISDMQVRAQYAERTLVRFYFGVNILASYLVVMLKEYNVPRISTKDRGDDDKHDLWDLEQALKRLVDDCANHLETIPNRFEFYDGVGCPLCPSEY